METQARSRPRWFVVAGEPVHGQASSRVARVRGVAIVALAGGILILCLAAVGRVWSIFDIAAHFGLHAIGAVTGGLLGLVLLWFRRPLLAFAGIISVACLTLAIPVTISFQATLNAAALAAPPAKGVIRIVSLNTWHHNQAPLAMVRFLEQVRADVVVLAEFGPSKMRWLRRLAKAYPYQTGCAARWVCSVHILSRYPVSLSSNSSRELGPGPPRVVAKFGPEIGGLTVIGVHLMRPFDSYGGSNREVRHMANLVRQGIDGPVIVAGDFNLTTWSANLATFRDASGLTHMGRFLPTWPAQPRGLPQLAIDHVFASPGIEFEKVGLGPAVGSDHRPLIVDVRLPDK